MTPVLLQRPHTHAGRDYQPGDRIEVETITARWLIDQGVGVVEAPGGVTGRSTPRKPKFSLRLKPVSTKESNP